MSSWSLGTTADGGTGGRFYHTSVRIGLADLYEKLRQIVGVLLFFRENLLDHSPRGRIFICQPPHDLRVGRDRDPLGDQILPDHLLEAIPCLVLGMASGL